jgi:DNA processing protein
MIREGEARLVANGGDVVEEAGPIGLREGLGVVRDLDALSGDARLVYEALPAVGPRGVRELSELSGVAVEQVRAVLPLLEMEGFVGSDDTGWSRQRCDLELVESQLGAHFIVLGCRKCESKRLIEGRLG